MAQTSSTSASSSACCCAEGMCAAPGASLELDVARRASAHICDARTTCMRKNICARLGSVGGVRGAAHLCVQNGRTA